MYLDALAPAWRKLHEQLLSQVRILIVDDETAVLDMFRAVIERAGISVETAVSAEDALEMLASQTYDVLLTDKNLPGANGFELVTHVGGLKEPIPAIVMSGDDDMASVTEAFERGAADYAVKPLRDSAHLLSRIRALIDRRITTRLFEVMIHDLRRITPSMERDADTHHEIVTSLLDHRAELDARPAVVVCDDNEVEAVALVRRLEADGLTTLRATDHHGVIGHFALGQDLPLVAVVALELPGALSLIEHLRESDEQLEILVTAESAHVEQALAAVRAGAADFAVPAKEGAPALVARVRRLLARARRHLRYLHLARTLGDVAAREHPELAQAFARGSAVFDRGPRPEPLVQEPAGDPEADAPQQDPGAVVAMVTDDAWSSDYD